MQICDVRERKVLRIDSYDMVRIYVFKLLKGCDLPAPVRPTIKQR